MNKSVVVKSKTLNVILVLSLSTLIINGIPTAFAFHVNPGVDDSPDLGVGVSALSHPGEELIDFETFPGGAPIPNAARITNQFAPVGVALFRTGDALGPQIGQGGLAGQSGVNTLFSVGSPRNFESFIGVDFSSDVCAASILTLDVGFDGVILEAFNAANVLVDSQSITNGPDVGVGEFDTLFVSGSGIVRLEISQLIPANTNDGYLIDDLRFRHLCAIGGTMIPIDTTALLLASIQSISMWMIPVVAAGIAIGVFVIKRRK